MESYTMARYKITYTELTIHTKIVEASSLKQLRRAMICNELQVIDNLPVEVISEPITISDMSKPTERKNVPKPVKDLLNGRDDKVK